MKEELIKNYYKSNFNGSFYTGKLLVMPNTEPTDKFMMD
jgi:hypothetical protein